MTVLYIQLFMWLLTKQSLPGQKQNDPFVKGQMELLIKARNILHTQNDA